MRPRWSVALVTILAGVLLIPVVAAGGPPEKVEICHFNADDDPDAPEWELLEVASPSVTAHESHGDGFPGGEVPGTDGQFVFDENCVPQAVELVFAVAYTDTDTSDGGYNPNVDVLIAKLVDGPDAAADGAVGAGDLVITDQYPKNFDADEFGSFGVNEHTVASLVDVFGCHILSDNGDRHSWVDTVGANEGYGEFTVPSGLGTLTAISDGFGLFPDQIIVGSQSPSSPQDAVNLGAGDTSDQAFVDVDLNCIKP